MDINIGERGKNCSWMKDFSSEFEGRNISSNSQSYYINNCIFDATVFIVFDSKEGQKISKLLKNKKLKEMYDYIDEIVLKHVNIHQVKEYIENIKEKSFMNGLKEKSAEIREALGISNSVFFYNQNP